MYVLGPLPLSVRVVDPAHPFQLAFARDAAALLAGRMNVSCEASAAGLRVSAVSERDLDAAVHLVKSHFPSVTTDRFEVSYLREPRPMEPYVLVTVVTPVDYYGDVIGDLNKRRGWIQSLEQVPEGCIVKSATPVAELVGYGSALSALTHRAGRADFEFLGYKEVPGSPPEPPRRPAVRA